MAAVYLNEDCRNSFQDDLAAHLVGGYVFSTPDLFIMGRSINSSATYEEITDPCYRFEEGECDCWWVHAAAVRGSDNHLRQAVNPSTVAHFLRFEPYPLPLIGFERNNRPRFYKREILIRHAYRFRHLGHSFLQRGSECAKASQATGPAFAH